jgi:hypothetical protein
MNVDKMDEALAAAFEAPAGERRAVARMACDLGATGHYGEMTDHELTPEVVVTNLQDAPDDELASKWNWWLGALEIAFGRRAMDTDGPDTGFAEFQVRRYESDEAGESTDSGGVDAGDEAGADRSGTDGG